MKCMTMALILSALAQKNAVDAPDARRRVEISVVDAGDGRPLPCRLYLRGEDGTWYFPRSASPSGTAVPYRKENRLVPGAREMHTTLSASPAVIELSPGTYEITVERGKEYFPVHQQIRVGSEALTVNVELRRWIDMAALGWYSGDTHVHRELEELPNVAIAEDLNVSLPLLYWVTEAHRAPATGNKSTRESVPAEPIEIDSTHVIYPRNTEYEIFTVGGVRHTLGAVFVLHHKDLLDLGVPPVAPVASQAHAQGALLELDKHNWPWSMAIVPVMDVDLYELSNNHVWRAEFAFRDFGESPAEYMQIERDADGWTERGWIDYGFQNYYALLDCGFRLRPTAGTASGVHPVPLGFGRVYVHLDGPFGLEAWLNGLDAGRSFVTTGPMLLVEFAGRHPGHTFRQPAGSRPSLAIRGTVWSEEEVDRVEIVRNGEVLRGIELDSRRDARGACRADFDLSVVLETSSWLAVRCFERRTEGRIRFAHTAPVHVEIDGSPLRPRRAEVEYLLERVDTQIHRSAGILPETAIAEYRRARDIYADRLAGAREH